MLAIADVRRYLERYEAMAQAEGKTLKVEMMNASIWLRTKPVSKDAGMTFMGEAGTGIIVAAYLLGYLVFKDAPVTEAGEPDPYADKRITIHLPYKEGQEDRGVRNLRQAR